MSSLVTQPRTLVDVLLPRQQRSWLLDATLVVLFSAFVGLTAQVEIPLWPVPLTLQTLGVLFTGAVLASRRGALALLLYLSDGVVGPSDGADRGISGAVRQGAKGGLIRVVVVVVCIVS